VANGVTGESQTHHIPNIFPMLGAAPNTEWLGDAVALDDKGFVLTGASVRPDQQHGATRWRIRWPPAAPAFSPSVTYDPDRSNGSPQGSARARSWWRRCTKRSQKTLTDNETQGDGTASQRRRHPHQKCSCAQAGSAARGRAGGTAARSVRVYGCSGEAKRSGAGRYSTASPARMTSTSWLIRCTIARSWAMKR
jgi:hypothetical protein